MKLLELLEAILGEPVAVALYTAEPPETACTEREAFVSAESLGAAYTGESVAAEVMGVSWLRVTAVAPADWAVPVKGK